jgi:Tat protein secretion system quality control protein TatD with DNase activity
MEECLRVHLVNPRVIALDEIGLDYHYDNSPRAVFERQDTLDVLKQNVPKNTNSISTVPRCEQVLPK